MAVYCFLPRLENELVVHCPAIGVAAGDVEDELRAESSTLDVETHTLADFTGQRVPLTILFHAVGGVRISG